MAVPFFRPHPLEKSALCRSFSKPSPSGPSAALRFSLVARLAMIVCMGLAASGPLSATTWVVVNSSPDPSQPGSLLWAYDNANAHPGDSVSFEVNTNLVLYRNGSFTGGLTLKQGTLTLEPLYSLSAPTGALTLDGGSLSLSASNNQTLGAVSLVSGNITATSSDTAVITGTSYDLQSGFISAILAGSGAATKSTGGTVTLSAANTYTGGTTITGGSLVMGVSNALADTGAVTINGGTLDLGADHSDTVGAVSLLGGSLLGSGTSTLTGTSYDLRSGTVSAILAGSGALTKTTGGTVTLSGANTYAGSTTISGGTFSLGAGNVLPDATAVIINGGTLDLGANHNETVGTVQLTSGGITGSGTSTLTGTSYNFQSGTVGVSLAGSGALTKSTGGTATLSAANTYTGGTTITGGSLVMGVSNALADTGAVTINGGTLDLGADHSDTVGAVSLLGGSLLGSGTSTLTGTSYDLRSGTVSAILAGSGALTKTTGGTVTLSGANTYTGGTTLSAGTLSISSNANLGGATTALTINGGLLQITDTTLKDFGARSVNYGTFNGGLDIANAANTFTLSQALGGGGFTKAGAGTLVLSGANTYTGGTTLNAGTLSLGSAGALGTSGAITFNGGTLQFTAANTTDYSARFIDAGSGVLIDTNGQDVTFASNLQSANILGKAGAGTLTLAAKPQYLAFVNLTGGTLALRGGNDTLPTYSVMGITHGGTLDLGSFNQTVATLSIENGNVTGTGTLTLIDDSEISNATISANLVSSGSVYLGGVTLLGTNTFSGPLTVIDAQIGNGGTTGTLDASQITLDAGTLTYNRSDLVTVSTAISGYGGVTQAGNGTLLLAGENTYLGDTYISAGRLLLGSGNVLLDSSRVTIVGGTFDLGMNHNETVGAVELQSGGITGGGTSTLTGSSYDLRSGTVDVALAGSGALTKNTGGTVTLSGANTFTGGTTLNLGTLTLGSAGALGTSGAINFNGGTLQFTAANTTDYSTRFSTAANRQYRLDTNGQAITLATALTSSGGSLTKLGAGTLTLAATNTYTGATTVSGGRLVLGGGSASSGFAIASGATLELNVATADRDFTTTTFSGSGNLVKSGVNAAYWGAGVATFALGSGSLIDVQAGSLFGGSNGNEVWTNNLSGLRVASGAAFYGVEANVRVDALTGAGQITSGYTGGGYQGFTFGVANGSGTFSGVLADHPGFIGNFTKIGTGTQTLTGANTYTGATTISGGILQIGDGGITGSLASGTIVNNASLIFNRSDASSYNGAISGTGALTKSGTGTLTLGGANTYTGGTTITGGTLLVTGSLAGPITMSGGKYDRALSGSANLANAVNATSSFTGGKPATTAEILDGILTSAATLQTSFANTSSALNDEIRLSDVYSFHGTGSDVFVLELSLSGIAPGGILGWRNEANQWVNAVLGNTGENDMRFIDGAYDGNLVLGHYGIDTATGSVWAVINHNSDFAIILAVPEPSTYALAICALLGALILRRRTQWA